MHVCSNACSFFFNGLFFFEADQLFMHFISVIQAKEYSYHCNAGKEFDTKEPPGLPPGKHYCKGIARVKGRIFSIQKNRYYLQIIVTGGEIQKAHFRS